MVIRRKRRPLCSYSESVDGTDIHCQRHAILTYDGVHYCEKHAQESNTVPYIV